LKASIFAQATCFASGAREEWQVTGQHGSSLGILAEQLNPNFKP